MSLYTLSEISDMISGSSYDQAYIWILCITCFFSLYVIEEDKRHMEKRTDSWSLQIVYCDKYTFCVTKTIEFYIHLITITHA